MSYIDNVLIKLRREYSKDELVSALSKRLSEAEIENGKLKSYIDELEDSIEPINKLKKELKRLQVFSGENIILKQQNESLKSMLKEIKKEYQPIKKKIHGNPKRHKRNGR
jgi:cell shape-determining protein MreC